MSAGRPVRSVRAGSFADDLVVALVPWLLARTLVIGAAAVADRVVQATGGDRPLQLDQGLSAWDGAFYSAIAAGGYEAVPETGLRFFPLLPLVGRLLGWLPGVDAADAVVAVANVSALVAGALLVRLVRRETGDGALARRSAWLLALAPHGFVFVLGYAEALLVALAVGVFLAARDRRWWIAAALAAGAGLARPVGVLLVVPLLVEAARNFGTVSARERAARLVAVGGAPAGLGAYLAWVGHTRGDPLLPLRLHDVPELRGGFRDPVRSLVSLVGDVISGAGWGSAVHLVAAVVLGALVVLLARHAPAAYAAYAGAGLLVGLSGENLDSLERYALSTFPFVVAAAGVAGWRDLERPVLVGAAGGLVALSALTFSGILVP